MYLPGPGKRPRCYSEGATGEEEERGRREGKESLGGTCKFSLAALLSYLLPISNKIRKKWVEEQFVPQCTELNCAATPHFSLLYSHHYPKYLS